MMPAVPIALAPGTELYKYHLLSPIGRGHFGQVWQAMDRAINREYAIKILNPGVSVDDRLREARIGNLLTHNNLVRIHQADVVNVLGDDVVILAMDHLPSGSVDKLANPAGFLPLPTALKIGRDVLQGLDYLHANNFFHNDIKPGNILIGPQGQGMLSDYGITCVSANGSPVLATSSYRFHKAPEVVQTGNVGVSTDIFQMGMTLLRMLVGLSVLSSKKASLSWPDYDQAVASGKLVAKADFPDHIPPAVIRLVLRAVAPNPAERFQSTLDMRRQLERLHFPGFWSVDPGGQQFGEAGGYRFTFELRAVSSDRFDLNCFKANPRTGRTQRVTRFCKSSLSRKIADAEIGKFKMFVVTGA